MSSSVTALTTIRNRNRGLITPATEYNLNSQKLLTTNNSHAKIMPNAHITNRKQYGLALANSSRKNGHNTAGHTSMNRFRNGNAGQAYANSFQNDVKTTKDSLDYNNKLNSRMKSLMHSSYSHKQVRVGKRSRYSSLKANDKSLNSENNMISRNIKSLMKMNNIMTTKQSEGRFLNY